MKKSVLSFFLALLLMASFPISAYAEYKDLFDISEGSVSIYDNSADQGGVTYEHSGAVTITGSSNNNSIGVDVTTDVTVTLDNVSIDITKGKNTDITGVWVSSQDSIPVAFGVEAMTVNSTDNATVTVELDGLNTLKSGIGQAGLGTENGNLVIQDNNDVEGTLIAEGGACAAGIGGGRAVREDDYHGVGDGCGNNITITGGTIIATGGKAGGAGIGGGLNGTASNITISGDADVTANSLGDIVIAYSTNNGTVVAKEYYGIPAAIGDGGKSVDIIGQSNATEEQRDFAAGTALVPDTDELYCTGRVFTSVVTDSSLTTSTTCGEEHVWDEGTVIKEPGVGVEGEIEYRCLGAAKGCKETWTDIIPAIDVPDEPAAPGDGVYTDGQLIYEVVTLEGEKLPYEEDKSEDVLTITVSEEAAVLRIYRLELLADSGIKEIVFKTELSETVLKIADYSDALMPLSVIHRGAETEILVLEN